MPRLVNTTEFVIVHVDGGYGIAATVQSKYGVRIVERPVTLDGGDAMDAITICKALNDSLKRKK